MKHTVTPVGKQYNIDRILDDASTRAKNRLIDMKEQAESNQSKND